MKRLTHLVLLGLGGAVMAYPFLWMVATAFKTLPESLDPAGPLFPATWQWQNLSLTFQAAPFGRYFLNSLLVSFTAGAAVAGTSLIAGYAFARLEFRGRSLLFGLLLATMMVPFELTFIPNFVLVTRLGWYNTYAALIVPWCASPFGIFLVRQAFLSVPQDLFDAAQMDGCGHLRFLRHAGVALVRPALAAIFLFAFLGSYNALLWPIVVTSETSMRVVQAGLAAFVLDSGVRLNLLMCASLVVILPGVVLYLFTQRFFDDQALRSGMKG
jgi:ABC-type glycerol-3-phosphate transport system permease component